MRHSTCDRTFAAERPLVRGLSNWIRSLPLSVQYQRFFKQRLARVWPDYKLHRYPNNATRINNRSHLLSYNIDRNSITDTLLTKMRNLWLSFLVLGIAFIAIGLAGSGQRAFIYIGIVFLVVALLRWHRTRS
jgi:hypothetical protein